jgi:murein DD-endopeptidase MepM/ murein hydrolase activator NlpD
LIGLIETTDARVKVLDDQLSLLNGQVTDNSAALARANRDLADRQKAAKAASDQVTKLAQAIATIRDQLRKRAVANYMQPVTGEVVNLFLHLQDPTQLANMNGYYHALVDGETRDVAQLQSLSKKAVIAQKAATAARDSAQRQQTTVQHQHDALTALQSTLQSVRTQSQNQSSQQQTLLAEASSRQGEFASLVAAQAQQSSDIGALLRAASPGGDTTALPGAVFALPIPGAPITSPYGPRIDPLGGPGTFHPGTDFGAPMGTPIHAAGDGIIAFAGVESGYGNYTCIQHASNLATCYGHQSLILVKTGDKVKQGQVIGLVGSTGYSTGPHLHFEVRINGQVTDPLPFLLPPKSAPPTH